MLNKMTNKPNLRPHDSRYRGTVTRDVETVEKPGHNVREVEPVGNGLVGCARIGDRKAVLVFPSP